MDSESIFYTLLAYFIFHYNILHKGYNLCGQIYYHIFNKDEILTIDMKEEKQKEIPLIKYEDKFLKDIRKMEKEYIFDEKEKEILEEKESNFFKQLIETRQNRIEEINNRLCEIDAELTKLSQDTIVEDEFELDKDKEELDEDKEELDEDKEELDEDKEELDEEELDEEECQLIKEEQIETLLYEKKMLTHESIENQLNSEIEILFQQQAKDSARNFIINKRIEKLENCFVMETTPQGNVLMIYDNKRNSFKFYSDNTIPYRYLEVVGRKYVKMFDCRQLYVDMEEELNLAEEKWEKDRKEKDEKEEQEKKIKEGQKIVVEKKSVFAKFKSYNKDGTSGRVNTGAPPKNSIPMTKEQENEKILLKEKANRYTYEGKMVNFNFLKKVERKVVDKKYGLSFADFKKMQKSAK